MNANKPQPILVATTSAARQGLFDHTRRWDGCVRCGIGMMARHHVAGRGLLPAEVLFVGEGPGREEDAEGFAFVGPSGTMLQEWIDNANAVFNLRHGRLFSWALTNLVMCRPCDGMGAANRAPTAVECLNCQSRLIEFSELAAPKAVVWVGALAAQYQYLRPADAKALCITHPSTFLRSGGPSSAAGEKEGERLGQWLLETLA